jgi:hypothetical protein
LYWTPATASRFTSCRSSTSYNRIGFDYLKIFNGANVCSTLEIDETA